MSGTVYADFEYIYSQDLPWEILNNKCVVVTGATGSIGSLLLRFMDYLNRRKNASIHLIAIIRDKRKIEKMLKGINVEIVTADLVEPLLLRYPIDYVFHCAAITDPNELEKHPVEVFEALVTGTSNMLRALRERDLKSMVYLSSVEVYGQVSSDVEVVTETDLGYLDSLDYRNSFAIGKRMAENLCTSYVKEYHYPVKIARLTQTFGAGVLADETRMFAKFAKSVFLQEDIVIHSDGSAIESYCYAADVLYGLFLLLFKGIDGEAYNIVNEAAAISIANMAEMVVNDISGGTIKVTYDPQPEETQEQTATANMKFSSAKIRELGWAPRFNVHDMYVRMLRG